jgi:hypothetical protein
MSVRSLDMCANRFRQRLLFDVHAPEPAPSGFADSIQMTSAQNLMAERHVIALFLAAIPSGQARTHEKLAIIRVRNATVQLFLPQRRVWREKYDRFLTAGRQLEFIVRINDQKLSQCEPSCFPISRHGFLQNTVQARTPIGVMYPPQPPDRLHF